MPTKTCAPRDISDNCELVLDFLVLFGKSYFMRQTRLLVACLVGCSSVFGISRAAALWELQFKEEAMFLCDWIGQHNVPRDISRPRVCKDPDSVSPDDAYDQTKGFWSDWRSKDAGTAQGAEIAFGSLWEIHWSAIERDSSALAKLPRHHLDIDADANVVGFTTTVSGIGVALPTFATNNVGVNTPNAASIYSLNALSTLQKSCDSSNGFNTFRSQVSCFKRCLAVVPDGPTSLMDVDNKLFILTAESLLEDIQGKRLTKAAARVELQKTYIEIRERQKAAADREVQSENERSLQVVALAQQQQLEQEQRRANEAAQAVSEQQAARKTQDAQTQFNECTEQAATRRMAIAQAQRNVNLRNQEIIQARFAVFGDRKNCQRDPTWYRSMPLPLPQSPSTSFTSQCRDNGIGITCDTESN